MSGSRPTYKKPSRVYDYNYNLGEHYYKPQLRHADLRFHGRAGSPPRAKTFAERFAEDPVYGSCGTSYSSAAGRKSSLTDDLFGRPNRSSDRFSARADPAGYSQDAEFGRARFSDDFGAEKSRFSLGDRLLDAAGARAGQRFASPRNDTEPPTGSKDFFDGDEFFQSRSAKQRLGAAYSRAENFMNDEESFKPKPRRGLEPSADDLMEDMKREADKFSEASKLRSKVRASRLQNEDSDFGGMSDGLPESTESRIEKIRARAKARIAEAMEDDFATPAPSAAKSYFDDFDSPSASAGTKSVRISKRSMKTTFDTD